VSGQLAHGWQSLVRLPFPGRDPPPEVGSDHLGWAFWSTWHTVIIPAQIAQCDLSVLSQLRQLIYRVC
jgi:hypothetical protein